MLAGTDIILGVSGSIAAYKAVYLARLFVEAGAEVWPIMTASGTRFVGPLTFSALCRHRTITDMWAASEAGSVSHVELAQRAKLVVLAPATADLLARLAIGRAEDPLAAVCLDCHAPWVVAPAMETGMWLNPATQANVATLQVRGATFVMPGQGALASGGQGVGRMADPEVIFEAVLTALAPQDLAGQTVLVTAGPTREFFDPVRFVTNASSGKMGVALARVARRRGARVLLVAGPGQLPDLPGVELERVETTAEMLTACQRLLPQASIMIMAAAPADYAPVERAATKLKKPAGNAAFAVDLTPTPDILTRLGPRARGCLTVGFAAETDLLLDKARAKLESKDLDLIVANDVSQPGIGFATDENEVHLLDRSGAVTRVPKAAKERVAEQILDRVLALLAAKAVG